MGLADTLFDDNGNFLGRDFKSWAKILGFYAVYYTFLGVLFYGFTISYYLNTRVLEPSPVGGKPAVANARLDMPGAVVHPFRELMNERGDISRFTMDKDFIESKYCTELDNFFSAKRELNENSVDCGDKDKSTADGTCNVPLDITKSGADISGLGSGLKLDVSTCTTVTLKKMPMFTIDINKIIGWTPNDVGIHFKCYEYDGKSGEAKEEQKFQFKWLTSSSISADYFPFNGVSAEQLVKLPIDNRGPLGDRVEDCVTEKCLGNKPYNKPFVAGMVKGDFEKNKDHFFRCDVLSDKISRQFAASESNEYVALNADLRKLGLGFVEFGYKYDF